MPFPDDPDETNELIADARGFTITKDPYFSDDFVRQYIQPVPDGQFDQRAFENTVSRYQVLYRVIDNLSSLSNRARLSVVDLGVYAGKFTIAASIIGRQHAIPLHFTLVEAVQELISPIQKNFDLYGIDHIDILNAAVDEVDGKTVNIGIRKGGYIAAIAIFPERKAGDEGQLLPVATRSLKTILDDTRSVHALVKIDIEGSEVPAFRSIEQSPAALTNHVYLVEFAPWQCFKEMNSTKPYGQFLLDHFKIYNVGNWATQAIGAELTSLDALRDCLVSGRQHNTDLLLIPTKLAPHFTFD